MCTHVSAYTSSKKFIKTKENYQLLICMLPLDLNDKSINPPKIVTKPSNYELLLLLLLLINIVGVRKTVRFFLHISGI